MKARVTRRWGTAFVLAAVSVGIASVGFADQATPKVPEGWTFTLPAGNASSGRAVYVRMECSACHRLQGIPEAPPRGTAGVGPDLTGYSALPAEYLADSLIRSHTIVAAPGYYVKDGVAGMGNYNHFLTVQELIDLVAFLRSTGGRQMKP